MGSDRGTAWKGEASAGVKARPRSTRTPNTSKYVGDTSIAGITQLLSD